MQAALGKTLKKITTASAVAVVAGLFTFGTPSASAATATAAPAAAPARAGLPRFGQSGDAVKALQQALVAKGFTLVGGVDGVFSPRTRATLRNFQSVVGFRATGRLDLRTARLLGLIPANVAATSATVAAPTSVMSSLTDPARPGCATASTRYH